MRDYIKHILLLLAIVFNASLLWAQDARISHPFLWSSYYNPAYCGSEGVFKFDFGAQTTYTFKYSTFVDCHLSTEIGLNAGNVLWGFGLKGSNEYQGSGLLNISKLAPAVSVGFRIGDEYKVNTHLRIGIEMDVNSAHINKDRMVFADQLDPFYGKTSQYSAELDYLNYSTVWALDLGVGFFGQTAIPANKYRMPVIINYGFSAFNILGENKKSFYTNGNAINTPNLYNRRFCAQLEYAHPYVSSRNWNMYFKGYAIYEYQAEMHDIQFGFVYNLSRFMAGVGLKIEKYVPVRTVSDVLLHFVYTQPLNPTLIMRFAYSAEIPTTQEPLRHTSIHSLSLHLVWNYTEGSAVPSKYKCPKHVNPTDVAWYEKNNTFPTKSRK
ncbi:MAG: hypothetical protein SPK91_01015 [Bacteroidales bacterium]|nr:hypothetical protein [Bacteroidales bacterium]